MKGQVVDRGRYGLVRTLDSSRIEVYGVIMMSGKIRYYWHGIRVPWLLWAMFS